MEPFALWLAITIEQNSPNFDDEMDEAARLAANTSLHSHDKPSTDQIAQFLERGLKTFIDERTSLGHPQAGILTDRDDEFLLELMRRFGPPGIYAPTIPDMRDRLSDHQFRRELIRRILEHRTRGAADRIDEISEYISQFCKWVGTATSYHSKLADELTGTFGESAPDELRIMTPAIVDFGPWPTSDWFLYQDKSKLRTVEQQAELLEKISLIRRNGRAVHGFIGFDPWSYLKNRDTDNDSYVVMKRAIEQRGFVGVKLYPPMGFLPLGNAALPNSAFPPELVKLCRPRPVGQSLDDALRTVYQYCDSNGLAIMAHCADTIGSHPDYAKRSAPENWNPVLTEFRNLRVNLGHFGGIWDFFYKPKCRRSSNTHWPQQIAAMVQQYDNLYFDIADFSGVLDRWDFERCATAEIFKNIQSILTPTVKSRIMYGSDWMLLDREPRNEGYYEAMRTKFSGVLGASAIDDFLGQNAVRFLGLHQGQQTRARLEKFYTDNQQAPSNFHEYLA